MRTLKTYGLALLFSIAMVQPAYAQTVAGKPSDAVFANKWFDKILTDGVVAILDLGSADTFSTPTRVTAGRTAHFAFYYDEGDGKWYVNQNGTKVECNPDEIDASATPIPCTTAPIWVAADNATFCNRGGDITDSARKKDSRISLLRCVDSDCTAEKMVQTTTCDSGSISGAVCNNERAMPRCSSSQRRGPASVGVTGYPNRPNVGSWMVVRRGPDTGGAPSDLIDDRTVHVWLTGSSGYPESDL